MKKKYKILIYPCGTEIALEMFRSLQHAKQYELYGGSSNYNHGQFVFKKQVNDLPFITDNCDVEKIINFNNKIKSFNFDFILPAMDGVINEFARYRNYLDPIVVSSDYETTNMVRSKAKTYDLLHNIVKTPEVIDINSHYNFPIFVKPDIGQGSVGSMKINSNEELLAIMQNDLIYLEYLPGEEYTIDCFTNNDRELLYCKGRKRNRIKNGISVNTSFVENKLFEEYALKINEKLKFKGAWFFQLKESDDKQLKLLEVASRIAGTSSINRCKGVNLTLLTLELFCGNDIKDIIVNDFNIVVDRALDNRYKVDIQYDTVYLDYDDTVIIDNEINLILIQYIFQCINKNIKIVLISKHEGDLIDELSKFKILDLFDDIVMLKKDEEKYKFINSKKSIFIDDSYNERKKVFENCGINVFDINSIECLLEV